MTILAECLNFLPSAHDGEFIAGCFQADAAIRAADIGRKAAIIAACLTLLAASFALIGGSFVLAQPGLSNKIREKTTLRRIASTYLAEMRSLHDFLTEHDVSGRLTESAETREKYYFHPGDHWLKTYISDPTGVGVFKEELGADIVTYCCRMHNELGRLRWMHDVSKEMSSSVDWLAKERLETSSSLEDLDMLYIQIISQLRAILEESSHTLRGGR